MESRPPSESPHQDADGVRQFFEQWSLYRKVVDHNCLHHREAYAAIEKALKEIPGPFSFLDLGSGDASFTGHMLSRCALARYEAVDISAAALELAEKNTAMLACPRKLTRADFFRHVPEIREMFDVVFIGLSFHHLPREDKRRFLAEIRRIVRPGGSFVFYEPVMDPGETREEVMRRFADYADGWSALTGEEIGRIKEHVFGNDYPETGECFEEIAEEGGFASTRVLYMDEKRLYAVFQCS